MNCIFSMPEIHWDAQTERALVEAVHARYAHIKGSFKGTTWPNAITKKSKMQKWQEIVNIVNASQVFAVQ